MNRQVINGVARRLAVGPALGLAVIVAALVFASVAGPKYDPWTLDALGQSVIPVSPRAVGPSGQAPSNGLCHTFFYSIKNATVTVLQTGAVVQSAADGWFVVELGAPGSYTLRVLDRSATAGEIIRLELDAACAMISMQREPIGATATPVPSASAVPPAATPVAMATPSATAPPPAPNPEAVALTGWRWAEPSSIPVSPGCAAFPLSERAFAAGGWAAVLWRVATGDGLLMRLVPGGDACLADRAGIVMREAEVQDNPAPVYVRAFREDGSVCAEEEDCLIFTGLVVFNTAHTGGVGEEDLAWLATRAIGRLLGLGEAASCTGQTIMHPDPTCRRTEPGADDITALNQRVRGER